MFIYYDKKKLLSSPSIQSICMISDVPETPIGDDEWLCFESDQVPEHVIYDSGIGRVRETTEVEKIEAGYLLLDEHEWIENGVVMTKEMVPNDRNFLVSEFDFETKKWVECGISGYKDKILTLSTEIDRINSAKDKIKNKDIFDFDINILTSELKALDERVTKMKGGE